jgi:hypothetical protein
MDMMTVRSGFDEDLDAAVELPTSLGMCPAVRWRATFSGAGSDDTREASPIDGWWFD